MDTQQKYDEAEYFLEMMKENIEDRQKFRYNLSAFVSAARSVTFVLKKEFSKNPDLDEWYCKKQMQMKRDKLFKFFKNKRDYVIHKKGTIDTRAEISETINLPITVSVSFEAIGIKADGTTKNEEYSESPDKLKLVAKPNNTEKTKIRWFFRDWSEPDGDVVTLCERYIKKLKIMVEEAENKFGKAKAPQKRLTYK
uniref:Uncharacterized protein n=1 Tax=Candidatus Methanogaster sp. ANME-2c ERB4 TaxID=2759911 RepID=A0A7G9YDY3_9EURY|nr:hypothetical protein ABPEKODN_00030 [Methanosarcinales archaeon ANME-2c ERB4]